MIEQYLTDSKIEKIKGGYLITLEFEFGIWPQPVNTGGKGILSFKKKKKKGAKCKK